MEGEINTDVPRIESPELEISDPETHMSDSDHIFPEAETIPLTNAFVRLTDDPVWIDCRTLNPVPILTDAEILDLFPTFADEWTDNESPTMLAPRVLREPINTLNAEPPMTIFPAVEIPSAQYTDPAVDEIDSPRNKESPIETVDPINEFLAIDSSSQ